MFQVGDRVRAIHSDGNFAVGELGYVIRVELASGSTGIKFDNYNAGRHDCVGRCDEGYGWFVKSRCLELYSDNPNETIVEYAQRIKERR